MITIKIVFVIILTIVSGLFAGLTIGLMSLDLFDLKQKAKDGDIRAIKVLSIRHDANLLLATLLLGNNAVNAAISIILADIIPGGVLAGFVATGITFIFGEILPQSIISRFALSFGAGMSPVVRVLIYLFYPICKPISWGLNKLLGTELQSPYSKKELISVMDEYANHPDAGIDADEQRIVKGSLSFSHKIVRDVMTPNTVVFTLTLTDILDEELVHELRDAGFSRFPVSTEDDTNNIVGILFLRSLVGMTGTPTVRDMYTPGVITVNDTELLDIVLNKAIDTKSHMMIVQDEFGGFEGVITIEDIIEEIVGREIVDEDDPAPDMRKVALEKRRQKK
jgi:metal transporter CNNM